MSTLLSPTDSLRANADFPSRFQFFGINGDLSGMNGDAPLV